MTIILVATFSRISSIWWHRSGFQTSNDNLNCKNRIINSGLSYALGAVFIGVLIALTALLMKYKKRDDERLSKNLNRRKSQAQDEKQILKSYQNEQEPWFMLH